MDIPTIKQRELSSIERSRNIFFITDSFHKKIHPILSHPTHPGDTVIREIIEEVRTFYQNMETGDIRKSWVYACLGLNLLAPHGAKLRAIKHEGEKILL